MEIRTGKDIPPEDYLLLALIVNSAWKNLFETTPEIMQRRLESGNLFLAAYDSVTADDLFYCARRGVVVPTGELSPVGLLETITLKTEGKYENVPKDYFALTNKGLWNAIPQDADTLVMVDVTGLPTRTGEKSKGEVKSIISYAKSLLPQLPYQQVWTFTPDIQKVKDWHQSMGAKDTKYQIPLARPGWSVPTVNLMDYSEFARR